MKKGQAKRRIATALTFALTCLWLLPQTEAAGPCDFPVSARYGPLNLVDNGRRLVQISYGLGRGQLGNLWADAELSNYAEIASDFVQERHAQLTDERFLLSETLGATEGMYEGQAVEYANQQMARRGSTLSAEVITYHTRLFFLNMRRAAHAFIGFLGGAAAFIGFEALFSPPGVGADEYEKACDAFNAADKPKGPTIGGIPVVINLPPVILNPVPTTPTTPNPDETVCPPYSQPALGRPGFCVFETRCYYDPVSCGMQENPVYDDRGGSSQSCWIYHQVCYGGETTNPDPSGIPGVAIFCTIEAQYIC